MQKRLSKSANKNDRKSRRNHTLVGACWSIAIITATALLGGRSADDSHLAFVFLRLFGASFECDFGQCGRRRVSANGFAATAQRYQCYDDQAIECQPRSQVDTTGEYERTEENEEYAAANAIGAAAYSSAFIGAIVSIAVCT
jgi:hypothetical protein